MIVTKRVKIQPEFKLKVEVDVTIEDIINLFSTLSIRDSNMLETVEDFHDFMQAIPDEFIKRISQEDKEMIRRYQMRIHNRFK